MHKKNNTLMKLLVITGSLLLCGCLPDLSLPELPATKKTVWLEQGWTPEQRSWFHTVSQGAATFPVPFEWFMALEQPHLSPFAQPGLLHDNNYLLRFGFIENSHGEQNSAGLPVGFAVNFNQHNPVTGKTQNTIGLTCSACHTGHLHYRGTEIRIDGAPAMINLGTLTNALAVSLAYTRYVPGRFDRFATRVLGSEQEDAYARKTLKAELDSTIQNALDLKEHIDRHNDSSIKEGFGRVDALNRIGNQLFGMQWDMEKNYGAITAPVNFPHIWSASWFDWVQYDASIMQPLVRNAGEALGVAAVVHLQPGSTQFASTVDIRALDQIERMLAGSAEPFSRQAFTGLQSPRWPRDILGSPDPLKVTAGAQLYEKHCQSCHRPATDQPEFWSKLYWHRIDQSPMLLKVPAMAVEAIGTDPEQARVLHERTVDTTGMQLHSELCHCTANGCAMVTLRDDSKQPFALALGAVVQETAKRWYRDNAIAPDQQNRMNGERPNCLRADMRYKARPLNGIWATAPFLHNGSVPTLYALLSPREERPARFWLGNQEFDPVNVGYVSSVSSGAFEFDTSLPGNRNSGHEFADKPGNPGVIGPLLSPEQRHNLVEYLKTL